MKIIQYLFSNQLIEAIGWTLVHSLWQGALVIILLAVLLLLIRRNSAQLKYFVSFVSLVVLLGWSVVTFVQSYNYAAEKAALKESIVSSPTYFRSLLEKNISATEVVTANGREPIDLKMIKVRSFFQRNFPLMCTLWMVGMLFLFFRLIGSFIYLRRIRTYGIISIGDEWIAKLNELSDRLKIRRKVEAFFSPLVKVPMTLGSIKPVILFPISAFTGITSKEIEAILAHELAHVLRHDYFFNIIQSMMEILFFYHPAVWIISAQIRAERENSCDNIAVELTGDKVAYAKAIAAAEIYRVEHERLAMAFASTKQNSLQRIKRLQKNVAMKTNFIEGLIAAGVIVIGLTLASFTLGNEAESTVNSIQKSADLKPVTAVEVDSILTVTQKNISKNNELEGANKELERAIEVALSEQDTELSAEMLEEINKAVADLNIEKVVREAMAEAQKALKEVDAEKIMNDVQKDIENDEIRRDMRDARREIEDAKAEVAEDFRRDMENATSDVEREGLRVGLEAATAGLNIAASVLENLPIEEIISAALSGVEVALKSIGEIDFDSVYETNEISEKELEQLKAQLKEKDNQLKEQQKQLEVQMKELKLRLDSIDKAKK